MNKEELFKMYKQMHTPWVAVGHQQRNELCNCGSGKKFKKCCVATNKQYKLKD